MTPQLLAPDQDIGSGSLVDEYLSTRVGELVPTKARFVALPDPSELGDIEFLVVPDDTGVRRVSVSGLSTAAAWATLEDVMPSLRADIGRALNEISLVITNVPRKQFQTAGSLVRALTAPAPAISLAAVAERLRTLVDLPVQEIAKMCGVRRRQFYNLLDGTTKHPQEEQHIRLVYQFVLDVSGRVGDDARAVRSAILTPLEPLDYRSFFDTALGLDRDALRVAHEALVAYIASGTPISTRLSPTGTFVDGSPEWLKAHEYLEDVPASATDTD